MTSGDANLALDRFFLGISEYVFHTQLGVVDTELIDYVGSLLIRFTRTESFQRLRTPNGQPATQIVVMLSEADQRLGEAKREVHRHIGDYTLFWSGLYPEALRQSDCSQDSDQFVAYCAHGKRSYRIASSIQGKDKDAPNELLRRLSEQFELCAYGLREIRREWERTDGDGGTDRPLLI
jgi:rhodanese-related sulfurtransferase